VLLNSSQQKVIRRKSTEGPDEDLIRVSATKWMLKGSEIEFTEVEFRTIAHLADGLDSNEVTDAESIKHGSGLDTRGWILDLDYNYVSSSDQNILMIPFIWSPKIVYVKRDDDLTQADSDQARTELDIYGVQIELSKRRLRDIESAIRHYRDVQKALSYRIDGKT
jgi:hypothetical protein